MKILLLVDDYLPHSTKIGAKMMHELAIALVERGNKVTVATPEFRIQKKFIREELDGVEIFRFKSANVKHNSKVKRALNETALPLVAWKNLKPAFEELHFDLIVYYSPSIFFGPLVKRLKKKWNAKSYLILRDLFPQWVIDHGLLKETSLIAKCFRRFERVNYEVADKIGLQSQKNLECFVEKNGASEKTEVLYNWTNEKQIEDSSGTFRTKYKLEGKVIFFYGGNMGEAQDMMNLVRLIRKMKGEKNAHFVFAGSGNEFDLVQEAIDLYDLENLTLLKPVSQDTYREMLAEFDIGLFSLHRDHTTHNFPGKLLGYMAQGLPVLGSVNPENDVIDVIENAGAGYVCLNGDDEVFHSNARRLLTNEESRRLMGNNARKLLEERFSVSAAVETIVSFHKQP